MPGKRQRTSYSGASASSYAPSVADIRRIASSVVNKKLETKHKTTTQASFLNIGAVSGTLIEVSRCAQGAPDSYRVGNRIDVTKLYVDKSIRLQPGNSQGFVRVLIVQSRTGVLTTSDMPSLHSPVDLDKMFVLYDNSLMMHANVWNATLGDFAAGSGVHIRKKFPGKRLFNRQLHYDDAGVACVNNPIYLYMFADTDGPHQAGFETMYYKDA